MTDFAHAVRYKSKLHKRESIAFRLDRLTEKLPLLAESLTGLDVDGRYAMKEIFDLYKGIGTVIYEGTDTALQRVQTYRQLLKQVEEQLEDLEDNVRKTKALSDDIIEHCKTTKGELEAAQGELLDEKDELSASRNLKEHVVALILPTVTDKRLSKDLELTKSNAAHLLDVQKILAEISLGLARLKAEVVGARKSNKQRTYMHYIEASRYMEALMTFDEALALPVPKASVISYS